MFECGGEVELITGERGKFLSMCKNSDVFFNFKPDNDGEMEIRPIVFIKKYKTKK